MMLPNGRTRCRLMKRFAHLGPYIREEKCNEQHFFFDCLAVCVNIDPAPEEREFYGWWLVLNSQSDRFIYQYYSGLFDKQGNWMSAVIKGKENRKKLEETKRSFHHRLKIILDEMEILLEPAEQSSGQILKMTA